MQELDSKQHVHSTHTEKICKTSAYTGHITSCSSLSIAPSSLPVLFLQCSHGSIQVNDIQPQLCTFCTLQYLGPQRIASTSHGTWSLRSIFPQRAEESRQCVTKHTKHVSNHHQTFLQVWSNQTSPESSPLSRLYNIGSRALQGCSTSDGRCRGWWHHQTK